MPENYIRLYKVIAQGKVIEHLGRKTFSKTQAEDVASDLRRRGYGDVKIERWDPKSFSKESRHVSDFSTLPELIAHARAEGATHTLTSGGETLLYFPLGDGQYEEAKTWRKEGYWHTQGPTARKLVRRPPREATPISAHGGRRAAEDYVAIDTRDRVIGGPFKHYSEAKTAAGRAGLVKFVPARPIMHEANPAPVDDPEYIIQGLYRDGTLAIGEYGFDDENVTLNRAQKLARANWFEGDYVRVVTRDGELVWSSNEDGGLNEARGPRLARRAPEQRRRARRTR